MFDSNSLLTSPLQGWAGPSGSGLQGGETLSAFTDNFFIAFLFPLVPDTAAACCTSFSCVDRVLIHDASAAFSGIPSALVANLKPSNASGTLLTLDYRLRDSIAFSLTSAGYLLRFEAPPNSGISMSGGFSSSLPYIIVPLFFGCSVKRFCPSSSCHSWLLPGSMLSPLVEAEVGGNSRAADGASGPLAAALGFAPSFGRFTSTGTRSRHLRQDGTRRRRTSSASTGTRADPGDNLCDRRSRRGNSRYRWGRGRRLVRPAECDAAQQLPPSWCPYRCVLSVNGIHQRGVMILEFGTDCRRTFLGGVVYQRTPGDESDGRKTKTQSGITGCARVGVCAIMRCINMTNWYTTSNKQDKDRKTTFPLVFLSLHDKPPGVRVSTLHERCCARIRRRGFERSALRRLSRKRVPCQTGRTAGYTRGQSRAQQNRSAPSHLHTYFPALVRARGRLA